MRTTRIIISLIASLAFAFFSYGQESKSIAGQINLRNFKPVSVFKLDEHHPEQAKYRCVDIHSHPFIQDAEGIRAWVETLEKNNVGKVIILTYACGEEFDRLYDLYTGISDKFELWCGLDMRNFGQSDFAQKAVAELERCYKKGAKGVGELGDKGLGEAYCLRSVTGKLTPTAHINDSCFDALLEKCAELGMPVSIHIGDPIWMYEPIDEHNDGLMNAADWNIDTSAPGILDLYETANTLEDACVKHPQTMFIACHLLNLIHDYGYLSGVLDRHSNLYLDNSARYAETSATPRATKAFYEKYSDRIFFGTDNDPNDEMYDLQWRILETQDEHFYGEYAYHWPMNGLGLSDRTLRKVYRDNYKKILRYQNRKK